MKPLTRIEQFLAKIAGNKDAKDIAPKTRLEHFLDDIAEAQVGKELPDIEAGDEGRLVGVTDGEYGLVDAPSGDMFVVTFEDGSDPGTFTVDKTYAEIVEQMDDAPGNILFKYGPSPAIGVSQSDDSVTAIFFIIDAGAAELYALQITVGSDDGITSYIDGYTLTPIDNGGGGTE